MKITVCDRCKNEIENTYPFLSLLDLKLALRTKKAPIFCDADLCSECLASFYKLVDDWWGEVDDPKSA
jgi:hypothetical protein